MNMLDIRRLRNQFEEIREKLEHRGEDLSELDNFGELDEVRRELIAKVESLKAIRNETSKQISVLKREKKDADTVIKEMREVSDQIGRASCREGVERALGAGGANNEEIKKLS